MGGFSLKNFPEVLKLHFETPSHVPPFVQILDGQNLYIGACKDQVALNSKMKVFIFYGKIKRSTQESKRLQVRLTLEVRLLPNQRIILAQIGNTKAKPIAPISRTVELLHSNVPRSGA